MMTRFAVSADANDGLNTTLIVHGVPTAIVPTHVVDVVVVVKSELAAVGAPPETTALVNAIAALELFVSVTVWAAAAAPTG